MGAEERQGGPQDRSSEEELRARLEEELRNLRVQDVLVQSVVSLINLTSRRIAKEDERDLGQARVGIEAIRALVDLLDPEPAGQVRNALSELQMHYAKLAGGGGEGGPPEEPAKPSEPAQGPQAPPPPRQGGKPPPKLWTPPGSS